MNSTSLRLEVGEERREVAGALEHRARGLAQVDAQLVRDDVRQRRLAEARRPEQQHVVERFLALARRLDEDRELPADLLLADVLVERARPQRALEHFLLRAHRGRGDQAIGLDHASIMPAVRSSIARIQALASSFSACRMPSATARPSGSCFTARDRFLVAVAQRRGARCSTSDGDRRAGDARRPPP